ncbi:unnamed protein product, partial [Penicillium discolor]
MTRAHAGQSVAFLLSLLIRSGVLPDFDIQAARFEHWFQRWLPTVPHPEDRLLLRRYCTWELLPSGRSLRGRPATAVRSGSTYQKVRAALKRCAALLQQIRASGETLTTYPQRSLDGFLTVDTTARPMTLTVGTEPIELPEVLAEAMVQLLEGNRSDTWLFPGLRSSRDWTASATSRR